eukprot:jgi/Ulvmu1/11622/UM008_0026.1
MILESLGGSFHEESLDCHTREPDPQLVSCALRVRNVPEAVSHEILLELFNQGGHVEHLETFQVPPRSRMPANAEQVTCKVRYCTVASSLSAFVMFYHTLVLRGQPIMVDFWQPETATERVTVPEICNYTVLDLVQKFNALCALPPPRGFQGLRLRHLVPVAPPPQLPGLGLTVQLTEDPILRKLADDAIAAGHMGVDPFLPMLAAVPVLVHANIIPPRPCAEAEWHTKWLQARRSKSVPARPLDRPKRGAGLYAPGNQQASAALHGALTAAGTPHDAAVQPAAWQQPPVATGPAPHRPQHAPGPQILPAPLVCSAPLVHPGPHTATQGTLLIRGPNGAPLLLQPQPHALPISAPPGAGSHAPVPMLQHVPHPDAPWPPQPGSVPLQQPLYAPSTLMHAPMPMLGPPVPAAGAPSMPVVTAWPAAARTAATPLGMPDGLAAPQQAALAGQAQQAGAAHGTAASGPLPPVPDVLAAVASLCEALHLEGSETLQNGKAPSTSQQSPAATDATPAAAAAVAAAQPVASSAGRALDGAAGDDEILGYYPLPDGTLIAITRSALLSSAAGAAILPSTSATVGPLADGRAGGAEGGLGSTESGGPVTAAAMEAADAGELQKCAADAPARDASDGCRAPAASRQRPAARDGEGLAQQQENTPEGLGAGEAYMHGSAEAVESAPQPGGMAEGEAASSGTDAAVLATGAAGDAARAAQHGRQEAPQSVPAQHAPAQQAGDSSRVSVRPGDLVHEGAPALSQAVPAPHHAVAAAWPQQAQHGGGQAPTDHLPHSMAPELLHTERSLQAHPDQYGPHLQHGALHGAQHGTAHWQGPGPLGSQPQQPGLMHGRSQMTMGAAPGMHAMPTGPHDPAQHAKPGSTPFQPQPNGGAEWRGRPVRAWAACTTRSSAAAACGAGLAWRPGWWLGCGCMPGQWLWCVRWGCARWAWHGRPCATRGSGRGGSGAVVAAGRAATTA